MKYLIPVVLFFSVGEGFDFEKFLADSRAAGVKLEASHEADTVNGDAMYGSGTLRVEIYEAFTPAKQKGKNIRGRVGRLPPANIKAAEALVSSAVSRN